MPSKQVLIICDTFAPAFAPRMGYLCKNLPELGWKPVVVTEYVPSEYLSPELADNVDVEYVNFYKAKSKFGKKIEWFLIQLADYFLDYKDRVLIKHAQRKIKQHAISLILVSSYRTFPLQAAYKVSKKNKLPLVVDLRDIMEQFAGNEFVSFFKIPIPLLNRAFIELFKKKLLSQRNKVLKYADSVTTVSEWHVDVLKSYNKNTTLIYNGFDGKMFFPKKQINQQFVIVYMGKVISLEMRTPALLFEAVKKLADNLQIDSSDFRIQFYTNAESKKMIGEEVHKYQITEFVDFFAVIITSF